MNNGNVLSYETCMNNFNFPVPYKYFCYIVSPVPPFGLYGYNNMNNSFPELKIRSKLLLDPTCSNTYIRNTFVNEDYTLSKGTPFWNSILIILIGS